MSSSECHSDKCHYNNCHFNKWRLMNVILMNVITIKVILLNGILLIFILLSCIILLLWCWVSFCSGSFCSTKCLPSSFNRILFYSVPFWRMSRHPTKQLFEIPCGNFFLLAENLSFAEQRLHFSRGYRKLEQQPWTNTANKKILRSH
jgi:hypothetical protein